MSSYHIRGLDASLTEEVRRTMLSPGYGHPVMRELARGTGPCRACLRLFRVGSDERLLFTYRPAGHDGTGAPGPVFIHAERCARYSAPGFPPDLISLPVILEARTADHRVPSAPRVAGAEADAALETLFANPDVQYVDIRHGEAGCHIARARRDTTATDGST